MLSAPVIALIALHVLVSSGRPVFYCGTRLGRDKRPFGMLKLRTLRVGASQITGGDLLGNRHHLTIPGGRFLRETRLDELPQLWNIVRGDMSFVGPRPERPEVFEAKCSGIPGYERRFAVRPGLIGISQLFTPHGTPKRYRTLIDNCVMPRRSQGIRALGIVCFTVLVVAYQVTRRALLQVSATAGAIGRFREKRKLRRVAPQGAVVHIARPGSQRVRSTPLLDMNEETILVECEPEPGLSDTAFVLDIPVHGRRRATRRTARCIGKVVERRNGGGADKLVIRYTASSPCSEYMIHQYFLRSSLAVPRRSWNGPAPAPVQPLSLSAAVNSVPASLPAPPPGTDRRPQVSLS